MEITADSGAVDTVGPQSLGKGLPRMETEASRSGKFYRAANNTKIAIHGKKALRGYTREGSQIGIDVHIADVKKALGSARRVAKLGIALCSMRTAATWRTITPGNALPSPKKEDHMYSRCGYRREPSGMLGSLFRGREVEPR